MFSISKGFPNDRQSSKWLRNILSFSCVTFSWFASSRFMIHSLPCPCGSTNTGYRLARVTMMPFWTDNSSVGRPCNVHSPTSESSTKNLAIAIPGVWGTFSFTQFPAKSRCKSNSRNSLLKGPRYDTNAEAKAQSPVNRWIWVSNSLDCEVQRDSSPAKAKIKAFAESIFFWVAAASSSNACFCAMAASNCACISSSLACTFAMRSSAAFFSFVATFNSASASRNLPILGSTTLATSWYVHMASDQLHKPATFPEAFLAAS
mmetsp:Transcript_6332/g.12238  ORF Transcript_6332/g.12238 Transcript_6332/m.12238 type:complete len:261 (-) Transcript_6332:7355-8137(-)